MKLDTRDKIQGQIEFVYDQLDDVYTRLEKGQLDSHYDANARNSLLGSKIKLIAMSMMLSTDKKKPLKIEAK